MSDKVEYYSNAKWTKINDTYDKNGKYENAESIAMALTDRWGIGEEPCEVRGNCTKSWVSTEPLGKEV